MHENPSYLAYGMRKAEAEVGREVHHDGDLGHRLVVEVPPVLVHQMVAHLGLLFCRSDEVVVSPDFVGVIWLKLSKEETRE